jgi:hypothetical protein
VELPAYADQSGQAGISATSDLLAAAGLTPKLYGVVTTKAPGNAFSGILGDVQLFRLVILQFAAHNNALEAHDN